MRDKRLPGRARSRRRSHALDQGRVAGVPFAGGGVHEPDRRPPRLPQDDGRTTPPPRRSCSRRSTPRPSRSSTPTTSGPTGWSRTATPAIIRFGFGKTADYRATRRRASPRRARSFILHTPDGRAEVNMPLIGKHNIENALAAAALVGEVFGLSVHQIAAGLRDAQARPGGLQAVRLGQPFAVLVDYAHTDDALENVLTRPAAADATASSASLFGCGGDRDRTKRPRMATHRREARRRDLRHQRQPADGGPAARSSTRSSPGFTPTDRQGGRRRARPPGGDRAGARRRRAGRRRADRRQGPRELPDRRRRRSTTSTTSKRRPRAIAERAAWPRDDASRSVAGARGQKSRGLNAAYIRTPASRAAHTHETAHHPADPPGRRRQAPVGASPTDAAAGEGGLHRHAADGAVVAVRRAPRRAASTATTSSRRPPPAARSRRSSSEPPDDAAAQPAPDPGRRHAHAAMGKLASVVRQQMQGQGDRRRRQQRQDEHQAPDRRRPARQAPRRRSRPRASTTTSASR